MTWSVTAETRSAETWIPYISRTCALDVARAHGRSRGIDSVISLSGVRRDGLRAAAVAVIARLSFPWLIQMHAHLGVQHALD